MMVLRMHAREMQDTRMHLEVPCPLRSGRIPHAVTSRPEVLKTVRECFR